MMSNITPTISLKRQAKLHNKANHPICHIKRLIQNYFVAIDDGFKLYDSFSEEVSVADNFDNLLIPKNHPARSQNDTYYIDDVTVLRTHTSAHQNSLLKMGIKKFLVTGDVYRKDTIDKSHYPVFHQMEGVKIVDQGVNPFDDLKWILSGLIEFLYPNNEYRFLDDFFPFTNPSFQAEIKIESGEWMEVLGGGVIQSEILKNCNINGSGWAFGLGLDRLLLHKCGIPDIRYLWTDDERFVLQFINGLCKFKEYSIYPSITRDISFWTERSTEDINVEQWVEHNNFCEQCREIGNDLIESITKIDCFENGIKISYTYRIIYRSNDRTLLNEEINIVHEMIRKMATNKFNVIIR